MSSDRAIVRVAKRRRAQPIRSEDFWAQLKRDLARPVGRRTEPEEKEAGLDSGATQEWLREFGFNGLPGGQSDGFRGADE